MGINEVRPRALALNDDERAQLADELIESLHPAGMNPEDLDEVLAARTASVREGTAVLHDISKATEALERMLAERKR